MAGDKNALTVIKKIFTEIPLDIEDIRFRQDIMRDLVENSELSEGLSEIIFMIQTLKDYDSRTSLVSGGETSLYTLLENLREISAYGSQATDNMLPALAPLEERANKWKYYTTMLVLLF